jgi:hypothetical protein
LTSDEFFDCENVREVFEGEPIYMAFIDGLHTIDQALKDFMNVERHAAPHSIVLFHDVFPVTAITASRERKSIFWCGDTWKVIYVLRRFRPDLKVFTIPTYHSGLAVVTNLDPESDLLWRGYSDIISEAMSYKYELFAPDMAAHLNETKNDFQSVVSILNN